MTTAGRDEGVSCVVAGTAHLRTLMAIHQQVAVAIERNAVEVVRAWLLAWDRSWLAVNFTRTRPEAPFAGDEGLAVAVRNLPRRAFGSGLDLRGSFIVRLEALNAILGLAHGDRSLLPVPVVEHRVPGMADADLVVPAEVWTAFLQQEMRPDREPSGAVSLVAVAAQLRQLMEARLRAGDSAA
ncbi:hypothetical protein MTY66_63340 (plasmid) [Mycolicibacterium sp. TY66]|uniref:hypothetical protein n=1 Tax=unclassified Mycolicibacterium TaxID=2636767 RepID=UPI001BB3B65A|nr:MULTISPECIES: hypothetical protein [unclassified Mycolicibacterium]BCI84709.1 hypothetical protein MTY66_63340 [Mycolicibacterium sp. TY66]BCJ84938.1 hypothetical protein MTY81_63110 [Mycolicibacterium sp. TY81]